jgi:diguanylate cyclase (GGDEF)-like protein
MKLPVSPAAAGGAEWLRRNITMIDILIVAVAVGVFVLMGSLNSFEWFYAVTRAHEEWQLDEIANAFVVTSVALAIMLFIRERRLAREVHRRMAAEAAASALARHDPLTGIANRRLFNERLQNNLIAAEMTQIQGAVLVLDLNRFKAVNDVYGHNAGDQLLVAVTDRIRPLVRAEDTFARLGGDEFGLALSNVDRESVARLVNRLSAALEGPFDLDGIHVEIGASIGVAFFPEDAKSAETLIQHADLAMYRAKAESTHGHAFFDRALDEAMRDRGTLEADLRQAIGTDAIVPFYQPLVNLADGRITGFEMLARWQHPTRGTIMPEVFIPIAEDTRLIGALSFGLIRRALKDALTWDARLFLAVNISPEQFADPDLATKLLSLLAVNAFPANRLEIELTETALVADLPAAKRTIEELKRAGVRIAIDDFGKGYSSLYYLRELPFDVVKIDQSFVGTRASNPESAKIVAAVIGLSHALGISTVAEGVEDKVDAEWLRQQGCNAGQGFLYSKPVPAAEVSSFMAAQRAA